MTRIIVFLLICLSTINIATACSFPFYGDKYDALIKLTKLDDNNRYRLSIPRNVDGATTTFFPTVTLTYSSHELEEDCDPNEIIDDAQTICRPKQTYTQEIEVSNGLDRIIGYVWPQYKSELEADVEIDPKPGFTISVRVYWDGDLCPSVGFANIQE